MYMPNWIFNGSAQLLQPLTSRAEADYAERGIALERIPSKLNTPKNVIPETDANGQPNDPDNPPVGAQVFPAVTHPDEIRKQTDIDLPSRHGLVPGWGAGPGAGGRFTFERMASWFGEDRFWDNPAYYFWHGWTQQPNPTPYSQASGWEPGAINADGTPRHTPGASNPWRITILEHLIRDSQALLGRTVGYSFYAMTGGPSFRIRPLIWCNWANGNFMLHELGQEVDIGGTEPVEICGWFDIPRPLNPGGVVREQFYVGFGIDTTDTTLPAGTLWTGFKLGLWPYPPSHGPLPPATDIKYMVPQDAPSLTRVRMANMYHER